MGLFGKTEKEFKNMEEGERLDSNQFQARVIIEMLGKPKDHMEKTFDELLKKLSDEPFFVVTKKTLSKTKKQEDMFSRYAEIELWAKNLQSLITLSFDYMPSSIEIVQPEKTLFKAFELNELLNELQGKLHHVDMLAKNVSTEKAIIASNFFKMIENSIILSLTTGAKSKMEISKLIGVPDELLEGHLKNLIELKKIKQQGENYALNR